jgi:hypothetical protein
MKMKKITTIIIGFLFTVCAQAQMVGTPYILYNIPNDSEVCHDVDTKGTEFWVTFGGNSSNVADSVTLLLRIVAGSAGANVTLATDGFTSKVINIGANAIYNIDLKSVESNIGTNTDLRSLIYVDEVIPDTLITLQTVSGTASKALCITSNNPVSVYAFNTGSATTDATILLPIEAWGNDYYRLSNTPYDAYPIWHYYDVELIIAREVNTIITFPDNTTQTLQPYQVYYKSSSTDMSGRHITSNKPVAYFTHTTNTTIPSKRTQGDIIFTQMQSVDRWGKQFLVPNAKQGGNNMNNLVRIIASEDNTTVTFTGATREASYTFKLGSSDTSPIFTVNNEGKAISSGGTLNAGEWVELLLSSNTGACYITTSNPVGVCAYLVGDGSGGTTSYYGDPSITWFPALNQSITSTIVAPFYPPASTEPKKGSHFNNTVYTAEAHFLMIITKSEDDTSIIGSDGVDYSNVFTWTPHSSGYSYGTAQFINATSKNKTYKVENTKDGVIVMCYGLSITESYYYNAGSGACVIN